ncbi:RNA-binding domain-containing protein [Ceraceosorus guamensis]|uniref:RNA-binding domain-containing protein n=1 Tax=Ceraceosorus guamensis TaxID=1522189 RepID=A0A316W912_9BASI|nr:RNA-binding domain-containing protein [Ceraceosorus guamensis]PWN46369.1 RNA-binding domain-containing protein [Ceraceosorus guamensis]
MMSRPQENDRNQEATCYVGNLDDRASDALLWELMLQAGPVHTIHIPKDRITSAHQGYGFAEFATEADAEYAVRIMNGIKLFGKPLRVNKASSDKKQIDIGANLFVGNLDPNVDERLLWETFSAFGNLTNVPKLARDPVTNASKCYAFVAFDAFEASDAAIAALDQQYLSNRTINVAYAIKKDGKGGERHGTEAERLLARQARRNGALPPVRAPLFGAGAPPGGAYAGVPGPGPPMPFGQPGPATGLAPPPPPPAGFPTYSGPPPSSGTPTPGFPPAPPPPNGYAGPPPGVQSAQQPPPPPGFGAPPPGTNPAGPPPPGDLQGPPPAFMTGSNNAPLGARR